jgi:hypothetical protein
LSSTKGYQSGDYIDKNSQILRGLKNKWENY